MNTQEMTFFQLRELARVLDIQNWSRLRKAELRERLEEVLTKQPFMSIQAIRAT